MKTTMLLLFAGACAAMPPTAMLTNSGRTIHVSAGDKSIEAIEMQVDGEVPYQHLYVRLMQPILKAGESADYEVPCWQYSSRCAVETAVRIVSVAYSDSYAFADPSASVRAARRRDLIRDGLPVPMGCNCGPIGPLMAEYKHLHPGAPLPRMVQQPTQPDTTYIWWVPYSLFVQLAVDYTVEGNTYDACGNPQTIGGCGGPCSLTVTCTAACPPNSKRNSIAAFGDEGTSCSTVELNGSGWAAYGPTGEGGSCSDRYGVEITVEVVLPTGPVWAGMEDSCMIPQPSFEGGPGGGRCQ